MNIIKSIQENIINLNALKKIIKNYNYDSSSFILNEHKEMLKPIEEQLYSLHQLYIKLGLHSCMGKKILDIGSGFCYNTMLCRLFKHSCDIIERPPKTHIIGHESNLFKYFHKILKIKNIEYYEITSPVVRFKNKKCYDYIFIFNPTFNEKEIKNKLSTWSLEDWKVFLKSLHQNLRHDGKIILGLNKCRISDKNNNKDWNKFTNNMLLKYNENKIVDFLDKHIEYKTVTLNSLKI